MKYVLKYKVPVDFSFIIQKHINSLKIFAKKPNREQWKEAIIEKKMLDSWGGMWRECGGATYKVTIKSEDSILPVAEGIWSYQACTPNVSQVKNYAMTELRFVTECDMKIEVDDVMYVFFVRYLNEFMVT
jgi:hypothetical protein